MEPRRVPPLRALDPLPRARRRVRDDGLALGDFRRRVVRPPDDAVERRAVELRAPAGGRMVRRERTTAPVSDEARPPAADVAAVVVPPRRYQGATAMPPRRYQGAAAMPPRRRRGTAATPP